jgi:hypothetical protein
MRGTDPLDSSRRHLKGSFLASNLPSFHSKESNGPQRDLRAAVCSVRVNAVVLLSLWNLFRFCFITVMYFEKWGVLLMHIVDFPVTRRSLQPKRKCEKKIIVHMSASLNERRKAETTISDPANKMAAT